MPRPVKCRRVNFVPEVIYFKPAGIPMRVLEEVCLSVEEAEAIRLKDIEKLEQEQCAEKMNISRPTFQRVLSSVRHKIADALLNGKAIRIEGGNYEMTMRRFRCLAEHEWEISSDVMADGSPETCPTCNTTSISEVQPVSGGRSMRGPGRYRRGRSGKE